MVFIKILQKRCTNLIVGKVYRIPGTSLRHFNTAYEDVLERNNDNGKSVIIGVDKNIDGLVKR